MTAGALGAERGNGSACEDGQEGRALARGRSSTRPGLLSVVDIVWSTWSVQAQSAEGRLDQTVDRLWRVGSGSRSPTLRRISRGQNPGSPSPGVFRSSAVVLGPEHFRHPSFGGEREMQRRRVSARHLFLSESFGNPGWRCRWRLVTPPSAGRSGASLKRKALPESAFRATSEKVPGEAPIWFTGGKNWEM